MRPISVVSVVSAGIAILGVSYVLAAFVNAAPITQSAFRKDPSRTPPVVVAEPGVDELERGAEPASLPADQPLASRPLQSI
jgi:hypothetical protein